MEMDRLSITQRIKMIKTYYKNGNSAKTTYRVLRGDYGLHNRPNTQAVGKIVNKFEETIVVTNIEKPVHHFFACSAENIAIISENVTEEPNVSVPRRSQGLCHILQLNLNPHPYKVQLTQQLKPADHPQHRKYVE